jgi:hypothetical protein
VVLPVSVAGSPVVGSGPVVVVPVALSSVVVGIGVVLSACEFDSDWLPPSVVVGVAVALSPVVAVPVPVAVSGVVVASV